MISTKENNLSGLTAVTRLAEGMGSEDYSKPSTQNFFSLNKNDRFTNGTGAIFEKPGNHTARIVKYPGKPWMVGTFYTFGAFNYVEKV